MPEKWQHQQTLLLDSLQLWAFHAGLCNQGACKELTRAGSVMHALSFGKLAVRLYWYHDSLHLIHIQDFTEHVIWNGPRPSWHGRNLAEQARNLSSILPWAMPQLAKLTCWHAMLHPSEQCQEHQSLCAACLSPISSRADGRQ